MLSALRPPQQCPYANAQVPYPRSRALMCSHAGAHHLSTHTRSLTGLPTALQCLPAQQESGRKHEEATEPDKKQRRGQKKLGEKNQDEEGELERNLEKGETNSGPEQEVWGCVCIRAGLPQRDRLSLGLSALPGPSAHIHFPRLALEIGCLPSCRPPRANTASSAHTQEGTPNCQIPSRRHIPAQPGPVSKQRVPAADNEPTPPAELH